MIPRNSWLIFYPFAMTHDQYLFSGLCLSHQVDQFSAFMTSLAQEAVEKICQLFHDCSSLLQLEVCLLTVLVSFHFSHFWKTNFRLSRYSLFIVQEKHAVMSAFYSSMFPCCWISFKFMSIYSWWWEFLMEPHVLLISMVKPTTLVSLSFAFCS